jgi:hypothetical protein
VGGNKRRAAGRSRNARPASTPNAAALFQVKRLKGPRRALRRGRGGAAAGWDLVGGGDTLVPSGSSGSAWSSCRLLVAVELSEARDAQPSTARGSACDSASPFCEARVRGAARCVAGIAKMFHDLNVPWTDATRELQRTVAFLDECERTWNRALAWPGASLTQCSRIRRDCPHAHLLGEAATRPGTYGRHDPGATAVLGLHHSLALDSCFTCAAARVMAIANGSYRTHPSPARSPSPSRPACASCDDATSS